MNATIEKAIEALEALPEEMRVPLVDRLVEQAEKYRALKAAIDVGMADVEAGRVREWDYDDSSAALKYAKQNRSRSSEDEDYRFGLCG